MLRSFLVVMLNPTLFTMWTSASALSTLVFRLASHFHYKKRVSQKIEEKPVYGIYRNQYVLGYTETNKSGELLFDYLLKKCSLIRDDFDYIENTLIEYTLRNSNKKINIVFE